MSITSLPYSQKSSKIFKVFKNQSTFWLSCVRIIAFSALTLLVGQQEGHLACKKTEWWSAGVDICLERGADLHMAQLMPLPLTVSCFSEIQTAVKRSCVCVRESVEWSGLCVCGCADRFWLVYCATPVTDAVAMATRLYAEAIVVPFMVNFVVFAKRPAAQASAASGAAEAQLRVFCMTDDKMDKTLECQERFTEIARSRDVEVPITNLNGCGSSGLKYVKP